MFARVKVTRRKKGIKLQERRGPVGGQLELGPDSKMLGHWKGYENKQFNI